MSRLGCGALTIGNAPTNNLIRRLTFGKLVGCFVIAVLNVIARRLAQCRNNSS